MRPVEGHRHPLLDECRELARAAGRRQGDPVHVVVEVELRVVLPVLGAEAEARVGEALPEHREVVDDPSP